MKRLTNPFFDRYQTPYEVPPFDRIKTEHYLPAFKEGINQQQQEIEAIVRNPFTPNFANTIEALDASGRLLLKVRYVFFNLLSANTSPELQAVAEQVSPLLSKHQDDINLNPRLFARVKTVYDKQAKLKLSPEQKRMLELFYKDFVRGGANLVPQQQILLREINKELDLLSLKFGENLLAEINDFKLVIEREDDLAGLPAGVVAAAAQVAQEKNLPGKWVFTLQKPSLIPFLQYAQKRELREKIFNAYIHLANRNNDKDNKTVLLKIVALRSARAQLLNYKSHADFVLDENMAKTPAGVYKFLNQLWTAVLPVAKHEAQDLQALIDAEGGQFKLAAWDWWYYAEKLRKAKYDLDDETLRPYFKLENVVSGMFNVAGKLYGLKFIERSGVPKPHPDAQVYEVQETDGTHLGVLYLDFFSRASKRAGAWQENYRDEYHLNGKRIAPIATAVFNFSRPTASQPVLLNFDETTTLFHEFGHALHSLFANCSYLKLSRSGIPLDFVELPSQIMENWATDPEVLKIYARHYQTGAPIPQELIDKIKKSDTFNQGFASTEYLAASFLDMDWHTLGEAIPVDAEKFEAESMGRLHLMPEIVSRYRSTYFNHIFGGEYSAGYYSYLWAQVLDADAFAAFKETGLFNQKTARSFRDNILSKAGSEDAMAMYVRFRGAEPKVDALLKRKGLK